MLEAKDVNQYYGGSHTLRNTTLDVPEGLCTCVMGRNGVGKTTLLKAIMGLVPTRSGSVRLNGKELLGRDASARARSGIGYVPQGRDIFPDLTVEENLRVGTLTGRSRKVPELVFRLFPVLKTMLRRRGGDLSGGQQQQLAIGRALVMRPRLLLLDEPTEGIQPSIIKDIGRAITYLRGLGDMAIVLVEQYLDFARELGDRFAVMDRGQIVYASTRADMDEGALKRALAI